MGMMSLTITKVNNLPQTVQNEVYYHLWVAHNRPEGNPTYGQQAFHNQNGLASTEEEREMAIRATSVFHQMKDCHLWQMHGSPAGDDRYGQNALLNQNGQRSSIIEELTAETRAFVDFGANLNDDCAISQLPLQSATVRAVADACNHIFHAEPMRAWHAQQQQNNQNTTCPLCRRNVNIVYG